MASDTPVPDTFPNLIPKAMITPVPVSNERGTNLTNLTSLEVENAKGGLGRSPSNNKNNNKLVHMHITNVLLDGNNNTQISIAIRESASTLPMLLDYIRTPASIIGLRWKDKDDGNKKKMFTEEQYEDLLALYSFLNNCQNRYGPNDGGLFDILGTTRSQFEDFIMDEFKVYAPVLYDEDEALKHQQWRGRLGQDSNRTTTSVHDINLWATHFNPITEDIAMCTEYTSELYWDEIN